MKHKMCTHRDNISPIATIITLRREHSPNVIDTARRKCYWTPLVGGDVSVQAGVAGHVARGRSCIVGPLSVT